MELQKKPVRKWKDKSQTIGKHLQITYPVKNLHPELSKTLTTQQDDKKILQNRTKIWIDTPPKKLYEWSNKQIKRFHRH